MAKKEKRKSKKERLAELQTPNTNDTIMRQIEDRMKKHVMKESMVEFSRRVEELVEMQDISYTDAILAANDKTKPTPYEPEKLAKLLTPELKSKLEIEAEKLNLIKKSGSYRLDD